MTVNQTRAPARPRRMLSRLAIRLTGRRSTRDTRPLRDRPAARTPEGRGDPRAMILPAIPMFHGDGRRSSLREGTCTDLWIRSPR